MHTLTSQISSAFAVLALAACSGSDGHPTNSMAGAIGRATSSPSESNGGAVVETSSVTPDGLGGKSANVVEPAGGGGGRRAAWTRNAASGASSVTPAVIGGSGGAGGTEAVARAGREAGAAAGRAATAVGRGGGGATSTSAVLPTAGARSFGKKFVGNITTGNSVDTGGLIFSKHWDQISPENAGKWGSVQQSASGSYSWATLDAVYAYATKNNIIFKEHCFIWGNQQPGGAINEASVKNWMTEFCKRYPETAIIDVVNEPPPHTSPGYANSIGGGTDGDWKWVTNAFNWARAACPNAILLLNDFNNIEWSNDSSHFLGIVKKIMAAGAPIDAIGAQSHDLDHGSVTFNTVKSLMEKLHTETGLPLYITEMDIDTSDDAAQLKLYQQYFPLFMETEYIKGITIWGWIYGQTWSSAPNSGLIRNGKARSAMSYLMNELGRPVP